MIRSAPFRRFWLIALSLALASAPMGRAQDALRTPGSPPVQPGLSTDLVSAPKTPDPTLEFKTSDSQSIEAIYLVKLLESLHYNRAAVHSSDYGEVIPDYMMTLDPVHLFFLGADKAAFMGKYNGATVYYKVSVTGDIDPAYDIYRVYHQRVVARINWIFDQLKTNVDLNGNETFAADRSKAEWPATAADADELWRRRLKFELESEMLTKSPPPAVAAAKPAAGGPNGEKLGAAPVPPADLKLRMPNDTDVPAANGNGPTGRPLTDVAATSAPAADLKGGSYKTLDQAKEIVRKRYAAMLKNLAQIDEHDLAEYYLTSIARLYDPHSDYFDADEYEDFGIQMKLQLVGIGAMLREEDNYCTVEELVPGGPADLGHQLSPHDKIISVAQDGKEPVDIIGMKLRTVVNLIRGKKGTRVHLEVQPGNATDSSARKEIVITRDVVNLSSQRAHAAIFQVPGADGKTVPLGVITLPEFYGPSDDSTGADKFSASQDTARLIAQLRQAGIKGLVLDLRKNGGGFLGEAINLAGLFIRRGPVVQVKNSDGKIDVDSYDPGSLAAQGGGLLGGSAGDPASEGYDGPLAVLTDRFSASASEIVAGALQNYGRAIIVGDRSTHGKGTVQAVLDMKSIARDPVLLNPNIKTGAAKITIQKFYLPNGSSTQLDGVVPDISLPSVDDYLPIGESILPHALIWDRIHATSFKGAPLPAKVLDPLRQDSAARQADLPEFADLQNYVDWFKTREEEKLTPLNLDERRKQKDSDDAFLKQMKADREKLAGTSEYPHKEYWLTPPPPKPKKDADAGATVDDDDDAVMSTDDDQPYPTMDVPLRETFRILDDAINLGQNHDYWASDHAPLTIASKG